MIILGIETSCDETALALMETRTHDGIFECRVLSSLIHSQAELHSSYGGVFPTLAKREHEKNLVPLLDQVLQNLVREPRKVIDRDSFAEQISSFKTDYSEQNKDLYDAVADAEFLRNIPAIDAIAVTQGPGLEPALWTGITFAAMLSHLWNIPVIPVNHMEGHIVGSLLQSDLVNSGWQKLKPLNMPALALLISGGHTELVTIKSGDNSPFIYTIIGQTRDDAVGEAFDKAARLIGLPYPGGPHISKMAARAREQNIATSVKLPRPMISSKDLDFSFSGLKTAVLYAVRDAEKSGAFDDRFKMGLAREFEDAVTETLSSKLKAAIEQTGAQSVIIGGGVSANQTLGNTFTAIAETYGITLYLPSQHISGDNALMIALTGALNRTASSGSIRAQGTKRIGL